MAMKKLAPYRAKRDFSKTREPSGREKVKPADRLRFVIQKHDATRLHYDFRLELGGVFKSWAVTRGPSLDPQDKRLAVEVEDHPLDYGDFEGTIPEGQYGGGTVMLWDRGYWIPEGNRSPEEALAAGDLKFSLEGRKLHGSWVLVRMKGDRFGGKRTNWLLIKHKDPFARPGEGKSVLAQDRSVASNRSLDAIAAGKGRAPKPFMLPSRKAARADAVWHSNRPEEAEERPRTLRERISAAARKTAARGGEKLQQTQPRKLGPRSAPMPDFIEPQLCKPVERPPGGIGWGHEVKFDGYRIQMRIDGRRVMLKTRAGLEWTRKFPAIEKAAARLPDAIIDGEVAALDDHGAPDFSALQAALSEGKTEDLIFFAFDLLFEDDQDLRDLPLRERKARLQALLETLGKDQSKLLRYVEHFETDGAAVLESARRMSLEGIISKRLDAPYQSGRHDSWYKIKCRPGHEVVIGGWLEGEAGRLRSLQVGVHRGRRLVYIGGVGTGFSQTTAQKLLKRLKPLETKQSPFIGQELPRRSGAKMHWLRPELVAEIEFAGWTGDGMVRHAAFKGLREDKPAAEVEAEKPARAAATQAATPAARPRQETQEEPMPSSSNAAAKGKPVVMGVAISHPDKVLWPKAGKEGPLTKLDLARYYEAMGDWMMRHLKGRPCSILRCPEGITGERFFQRHLAAGMSKLLVGVKVGDEPKPYLQVDRVEGLAALAQTAALELHPWNCRPGEPEVPGRLVFDLDPAPDLAFTAVIEAALELRDRLEKLGLVGFCKTTGGKGLHVTVPLAKSRKELDWVQAKAFARELCSRMATDSPERYLINMSKAKRDGRIFLDYLRNDVISTAVAPLSPRAREGATISMPLTWPQVKKGLDPKDCTLRTVPRLMARSKAWQDYDEGARPLAPAAKQLLG